MVSILCIICLSFIICLFDLFVNAAWIKKSTRFPSSSHTLVWSCSVALPGIQMRIVTSWHCELTHQMIKWFLILSSSSLRTKYRWHLVIDFCHNGNDKGLKKMISCSYAAPYRASCNTLCALTCLSETVICWLPMTLLLVHWLLPTVLLLSTTLCYH